MKKLIIALVLVLGFQIIKAQQVGVGPTSFIPTATLDIDGNLRIRGLTDSTAFFVVAIDSLGFAYRIPIAKVLNNCGAGFLDVPDSVVTYSIEINEHAPIEWAAAADSCLKIGAHLCSWDQWTHACRLGLALNNMGVNFEWTRDNTQNLNALVLGNGVCQSMGSEIITNIRRFRCCCEK